MDDLSRIKQNIASMIDQGATENEINSYLSSEYSPVASGVRGAAQGATFNLGDELTGLGYGVYDKLFGSGNFLDTYRKTRDEVREANELAEMANPKSYLTGEIGGGLAVPMGSAGVAVKAPKLAKTIAKPLSKVGFGATERAAGKGLGERTLAGMKEGAAYGTAYGFGAGEGDASDQLASTLGGTAGGAAVGTVLPSAVSAASGITKRAVQPFRGYFNKKGVAEELVADRLAQDMGPNVAPSEMLQRIKTRAAKLADDSDTMLADVGNENTRRLMRQAQNMPNENVTRFSKRLDRRQDFQPARLERESQETLGQGQDFFNVYDKILQERAAKAGPSFEASYNHPWNVPKDSDLEKFMRRGYMQRLLEKTTDTVTGMTGKPLGELRPWEILHRIKMEINREIGRLKKGEADSVKNWTLNDLYDLNTEYKNLLSKYNPKLGKSLDQYSDESALLNAMDDGFDDFKKLSSEELSKNISKLSPAESYLYRLGAQRQMVVNMLRKGNKRVDRTERFGDVDLEKKMKVLFPDQKSLRTFQRKLVREARKSDLRKAVQGGSKTDLNLVNASETGSPVQTLSNVRKALTGNIVDPVAQSLERVKNRFSGLTPGVAQEVLELGMMPPKQALPRLQSSSQKTINAPVRRSAITSSTLPSLSDLSREKVATPLLGGWGAKWGETSTED